VFVLWFHAPPCVIPLIVCVPLCWHLVYMSIHIHEAKKYLSSTILFVHSILIISLCFICLEKEIKKTKSANKWEIHTVIILNDPHSKHFDCFFLFQDAFISPQRRAIKLTRYRMLQGNHLVPPLMGVKGKISCRLYERVMQDKTPAATHQQNRTYYSMSIQ
jgi:hypothetical protein